MIREAIILQAEEPAVRFHRRTRMYFRIRAPISTPGVIPSVAVLQAEREPALSEAEGGSRSRVCWLIGLLPSKLLDRDPQLARTTKSS
ncbi:MAG: hypothetical protein WB729_14745 [Candidatus Sulfotelmatobacter sp.]